MGTHPIFESDFDCLTVFRMVLVLKTELNGDLRRIPLHNDFLTFDELHLMLCRVYQAELTDDDKLKYMDEDGDWVTIADSADLNFALESIRQRGVNTLKVRIGGAQCGMPDEIVTELKSIRDMSISVLGNCNKFLRKYRLVNSTPASPVAKATTSTTAQVVAATPESVVFEAKEEVVATPVEALKSFDPIQDESEPPITYVEPVSPIVPQQLQQPPPPVVAEVAPIEPSAFENSFTPSAGEPIACDLSAAYPSGFQPTPIEQMPVAPITPVAAIVEPSVEVAEPVIAQPPPPPSQPTPVLPVMQEQQHQPPVAPVEPELVAPVVQPVVPQSMFNAQPDTNAASSFFNSAASVHSTDGFNLSDRGSTTGSTAPTPMPVVPANPSPVMPAQVQQPPAPVQQPVATPTPPQVNQAASLHGQQQPYSPYAQQQQYQQAPQQQQQQHQQPQQQQQQQGYGAPPVSAAPPQQSAPPQSAPPAGPPTGMPSGGYRLNRGQRSVRPAYQ